MAKAAAAKSEQPAGPPLAKRFKAWWEGVDVADLDPDEEADAPSEAPSPEPANDAIENPTSDDEDAENDQASVDAMFDAPAAEDDGNDQAGVDALFDAPQDTDAGNDQAAVDSLFDDDAPTEAPEPESDAPAPNPEPAKPALKRASVDPLPIPQNPRILALECLWGEGRLAPSDAGLEAEIAEALGLVVATTKTVGLLGVSSAQALAAADVTSAKLRVHEPREPLLARIVDVSERFGGRAQTQTCEFDRPQFPMRSLDGLISVDAFTYADHKPGLATAAYKALNPGATWCIVDWCAAELLPGSAFASSWSEPQPARPGATASLLEDCGFKVKDDACITGRVLSRAETALNKLGERIDAFEAAAASGGLMRLTLKEMLWEAQSWRERADLMAAGALEYRLIVAEREAGLDTPSV